MVKGQRSASKFSCAAVRRLRGGAEKGTEGGLSPQYRVNNRLKVRRTLLLLGGGGKKTSISDTCLCWRSLSS